MATTSELPRTLPRPPPSVQPDPVTFTSPAKPRAYYARPTPTRELPSVKIQWGVIAGFGVAGLAAWAAFLLYATNQERLSSSVVRKVLRDIRVDPEAVRLLGDGVRAAPEWWLNGQPYVNGAINLLQGSVDFSVRVKGSLREGILYFTSIRKTKGQQFEILRYKIITDDGHVLHLHADNVEH
ncbi:DUF1783-domain-containing protein [Rickenella mellea]|uniref:DUF1783-domain-containing protein n=1 Tax=Rickenella mellea TaxID=50990 RepID=A0A4Y7QJC2_9AGAM|nr:DUF1783-domain-containing protein [Rickenella mellea]